MSTTALETLELLEWRLARIESALNRASQSVPEPATTSSETVVNRVQKLENRIHELSSKSPHVGALLRLQAENPQLFESRAPSTQEAKAPSLNKLPIVFSSASQFQETVSRLTALNDNKMPDASQLSSLIELRPKLAHALEKQRQQEADIEELRGRSATLLAQWYEAEVVRGSEQWADWDERLSKVEQLVRQKEFAKQREKT